ncbi:hypothetical protein HYY75_09155 [bacterium]|nr:hypothetical protein [bacterium]
MKKIIFVPRGIAGLVVVILVLGFMMAISTSYVAMIRVETSGNDAMGNQDRARFAAFAGVSYVLAQLQATSSTFLNGPGSYTERVYFATGPLAFGPSFPTIATSQYLFLDSPLAAQEGETASASLFRVCSYYDTATPSAYYVKSIGVFRDIDIDTGTIIATWQAQVLARLRVATPTKTISLESYIPMQLEPDDPTGPFFTNQKKIYP